MHGRGGGWNSPAFNNGFGPFPPPRGGWRGNRPPFGRGYGNFGPHSGPGNFGGMNAWSFDGDDTDFGAMDPPPPMMLSPKQVLCWLDVQDPAVLRRTMYHCKWLLEQRGLPIESIGFSDLTQEGFFDDDTPTLVPPADSRPQLGDMSGWYEGEAAEISPGAKKGPMHSVQGGKIAKPSFHRGGNLQTTMQWTPGGWAPKDNSHKITTTIKPLPKPDIIPRKNSETYPEADSDRNKLKMLENNVNMMDFELKKICRKHNIANLDRDDLEKYSDEAKSRLKTAVQCVTAAEKTLADFKEFLTLEKYKAWNEEQTKKHEESLKSMIGEMPTGTPHNKKE